jgi:ribosomal protein S27E
VLFHYFDRFLAEYEDRFEKEFGFFRPIIKEAVERYLDCGNPLCGFVRIRCPDCGAEHLLMFSCRTRGFCPSCQAKRVEEWGEWMREKLRPVAAKGWAEMITKCGGIMKVISFLTDYPVVDRIIHHPRLSFVAERPPPPHIVCREVLVAAETSAEFFS